VSTACSLLVQQYLALTDLVLYEDYDQVIEKLEYYHTVKTILLKQHNLLNVTNC